MRIMEQRLDKLMFEQGLVRSRSLASALIKSGKVKVNGVICTKTAERFGVDAIIEIIDQKEPYVSRGGDKLEAALSNFKVKPENLVVLDVGSSTGGFTDCVLRQNARKVYATDVGTDQLAPKLKDDPRVVSLEKTDIRYLNKLPEKIDLVVIDVSFISLEMVLPAIMNLIEDGIKIVALVKPQFETKKDEKNKSGVVKTELLQKESLEKIKNFVIESTWKVLAEMDSPVLGGSGNKEYFLLIEK